MEMFKENTKSQEINYHLVYMADTKVFVKKKKRIEDRYKQEEYTVKI